VLLLATGLIVGAVLIIAALSLNGGFTTKTVTVVLLDGSTQSFNITFAAQV